jgi:single-strand DNA-binding protein
MNHCIFVGNVVKTPQLESIKGKNGDVSVTKFKIGVNNRQRNESTFPYCEAWGKGAEMICEHFRTGDLIRVYCSLVTDSWPDKQTGETKYRDKFRVERFEFVEARKAPSTDETEGNEEVEEGEEEQEAPEEAPKPSTKSTTKDKKKKNGKPVTAPATRPKAEAPAEVDEDGDGEDGDGEDDEDGRIPF